MSSDHHPDSREIVLAGGGHAHVLFLKYWSTRPLPDVKLTLVSPDSHTPYSGMLPGLIAGHYQFKDIHIDLEWLCHKANAGFVKSLVTGIDPDSRQVFVQEHAPLTYDLLSIDTGSAPNQTVTGTSEYAVPVKPIAAFWDRWQIVASQLQETKGQVHLAVVGGGAGSVEIILAMAHACRIKTGTSKPLFSLVSQEEILPGYPARVRQAARQACKRYGIAVHEAFTVRQVTHDSLIGESGARLMAEHTFWCTQAAAPAWPAESGLACDDDGFICVNEYLQSSSHPSVFAAGDIAHMVSSPRPKAGVYAVRQGPVLYNNLHGQLLGKFLQAVDTQERFLSLVSLGGKKATGCRGRFSFTGNWVWHLKNRIDRRFIDQFK